MSPPAEIELEQEPVNHRNLEERHAPSHAQNVSTALMTVGKRRKK